MKRTDIINHLIKKNNYKRYLEIGVRDPESNLNLISIEHKDGVDPAGNCNFPITSDDFFEQLDENVTYDIIFIDGLHLDYQVEKDITNSLKHLSEDGTIVMHDCSPIKEEHQVEEYVVGTTWNGTTWKAYVKFRMMDENLSMFVVDTDHGVGVITKGKQTLYPKSDVLDFKLLNENRKEILNLITPQQFLNL
jgi:predicted O-methyltransferase YrrM